MNEEQQVALAQILGIGLKSISTRILTLIGLVLVTGMFGYALSENSVVAVVGASLFAVFVWALIHMRGKGDN